MIKEFGLGVLAIACLLALPSAQADKTKDAAKESFKKTRKENQAKAKELIEKAVGLEHAKDFSGAKTAFEEAEQVLPSRESHNGIQRTTTELVDSLVSAAEVSFSKADYPKSIEKLTTANELAPRSARILKSLAACYYKMGDRQRSLEYLDRAETVLPEKSPSRLSIEQYRSEVITGEVAKPISGDASAAVAIVNASLISRVDSEHVKDYRIAEADQESAKCKALKENEIRLPTTGPVVFNLAKCAQEEGRVEDANRYFARYLDTAPQSLDKPEVELRIKDIESLMALQGAKATEIRDLYSQAYQAILVRKYALALESYKKADELDRNFPQTKYKLAMLNRSMANRLEASHYFNEYLAIEPNAAARSAAALIRDTLSVNETDYEASVASGRDLVLKAKYKEAIEELSKAQAIFPLGLEVNSLLTQAYLNGNNIEAARQSMDVVASHGSPVYFYGTITGYGINLGGLAQKMATQQTVMQRMRLRAKIEILPATLRIILLERYNPTFTLKSMRVKKNQSPPPTHLDSAASKEGDHFGNIGGSSSAILKSDSEDVLEIPVTEMKSVTTQANSVLLEFSGSVDHHGLLRLPISKTKAGKSTLKNPKDVSIRIYPTVAGFTIPEQGWPSRKFANTYTRLFSQYLGFDGVKLGPEHMSAGEKWVIAGEIAMVAASYGSAAGQLGNIMSATAIAVKTFSTIQLRILADRKMAQALDFKLIPPESLQLSFQAEEFK